MKNPMDALLKVQINHNWPKCLKAFLLLTLKIWICDQSILKESLKSSKKVVMSVLHLTVIFAVAIYQKFVREITRVNIFFGYRMILLLILKMDIELGFTFQFMAFHKANS